MAQTELMVNLREALGKGSARSLRREGLVPAVVYGKSFEPCALSVDPKALKKSISTEAGLNTLITLKGEGPFNGQVVILKDMQVDAVVGTTLHADFQVIDLTAKVSVMVPLHPIGKSAGEKEGGNLSIIRHEIEVECLPSAIPASIDIDVTEMQIGDVIHVEDLQLGDGVESLHEANFTLLTVVGRMAEEEGEEEVLEGVAEPAEVVPEADKE
jgi:large subunit ribosomal protein L25